MNNKVFTLNDVKKAVKNPVEWCRAHSDFEVTSSIAATVEALENATRLAANYLEGQKTQEALLEDAEKRYAEAIADKAVLRDTHEKLERECAALRRDRKKYEEDSTRASIEMTKYQHSHASLARSIQRQDDELGRLQRENTELHGRLKQEAAMTQEHRDVIVELREKLKTAKLAWATAPDELRAARAVMVGTYGMELEAGALPQLLEEQNKQMKDQQVLITEKSHAILRLTALVEELKDQAKRIYTYEPERLIADRDAARRERDEHKVRLEKLEQEKGP